MIRKITYLSVILLLTACVPQMTAQQIATQKEADEANAMAIKGTEYCQSQKEAGAFKTHMQAFRCREEHAYTHLATFGALKGTMDVVSELYSAEKYSAAQLDAGKMTEKEAELQKNS